MVNDLDHEGIEFSFYYSIELNRKITFPSMCFVMKTI